LKSISELLFQNSLIAFFKMNNMLVMPHKPPVPQPAEDPVPPQHPSPDETPVPDHNPTNIVVFEF
jgi:hypothetical protein